MGREPVEAEIGGLTVTSRPLPFEKSQPLIPKVAQVLAIGLEKFGAAFLHGLKTTDDALKLAPVFRELAEHLDGKLEILAPQILFSTTVVMENVKGERQVYELGKTKDRSDVFDEHPEIYFQSLIFAGRVTFARFFPGSVRLADLAQKSTSLVG